VQVFIILLFGIFILSWSSIFIRWMGELDPLIIAFYRLAFSAFFLIPFLFKKDNKKSPFLKSDLLSLFFAGLFLAIHFYTWIISLQLTTVGNSIFLESTHPLFGMIFSIVFLKEKIHKAFFYAILLGISGIFIIALIDIQANSTAICGDLLALISAVALAAYLLIARIYKEKIPLVKYLFIIYSVAALLIFILILIRNLDFVTISATNWILLIILALGPNLTGHSILNWASRKMEIYKVNIFLLIEAVLATIYAALLLGEIPKMTFYFGAALILSAVYLVFSKRTNI